jgi:ATP-dependent Clp protease protease subunit
MSQVELPTTSLPQFEKFEYRIYLTGNVTMRKCTELVDTMYDMDDVNHQTPEPKPIRLVLNTPGGDMMAAQMVCDVIDEIQTPVFASGYGMVGSAGLYIFMACEKGYRSCAKYTRFLSHRFSTTMMGEHSELKALQKDNDKMFENMVEHYILCTGLSRKKVESILLPENKNIWMSAEECIKFGIVDQITGNRYVKRNKRSPKPNKE